MRFENLPPLNGLKYFEAAARNGSFTRAADELCLTQSAVSQQIQNLERYIGTPLFKRGTKAVELTDTGKTYFLVVRKVLERIDDETRKLIEKTKAINGECLCISASPSFASQWLVKRLSKFHQECPSIHLSINATRHYVDFEAENVDLAIRHGDGQWPGLHAELLLRDGIVAVCSPQLMGRCDRPSNLSEAKRFPLIEDRVHRYWASYARLIGDGIDLSNAFYFDDSGIIVEAAINGQGIALARHSLAVSALKDGRLIKLFDAQFRGGLGYYIVYPNEYANRKNINRVSRWLKKEVYGNKVTSGVKQEPTGRLQRTL